MYVLRTRRQSRADGSYTFAESCAPRGNRDGDIGVETQEG